MPCPECFQYIQCINKLERDLKSLKEQLRSVDIEGWKGKDNITIKKIGTDWHILEHRKDKDSKEIAVQSHVIPEQEVVYVWDKIKNRCDLNDKTSSRQIALDIITDRRLAISVDEFWGGKCRNKYYFPMYYSLKVLEDKGFIKYGGRGRILRLK